MTSKPASAAETDAAIRATLLRLARQLEAAARAAREAAGEDTRGPTCYRHGWPDCEDLTCEQIADAVSAERGRLAAEIGPDRLDKLADWFDTDDEFKTAMFPGTWPERGHDVRDDLRQWARVLRGEQPTAETRTT